MKNKMKLSNFNLLSVTGNTVLTRFYVAEITATEIKRHGFLRLKKCTIITDIKIRRDESCTCWSLVLTGETIYGQEINYLEYAYKCRHGIKELHDDHEKGM